MPAGHSAADEAARYRLEAELAETAARTAREMHRRYSAAAASEARLGQLLEPLEELGFHVLADRLWPGSRRANVDFVIVGPTGVVIVDAKSWGDVTLMDNRVFQGQADVTDRFENLRSLADHAQISLAEIGMAPGEIRVVAVFMGKSRLHGYAGGVDLIGEDAALDYILNRGARLRPRQVAAALEVVDALFLERPLPAHAVQPVAAELDGRVAAEGEPLDGRVAAEGEPLDGRVAAEGEPLDGRVAAEGGVIETTPTNTRDDLNDAAQTIAALEQALLASASAAPIEDWMTFLHPEQARLARRSFNGPSRIRGAAGTGKTVVGLHRAAYLARNTSGKVLVTTLIRTLPLVLESLMERMAPDVADRIEFTGIHAFALDLLRVRGVRVHLNAKAAERAFGIAWDEVGKPGILGSIDPRKAYWREEIVSVIKGRGLTQFSEYAALARIGRRRRLTVEVRQAVWQLYAEYDMALRDRGVHDFSDVILLAEKSLRSRPLEGYSSVIADEAQDLSCAMIRMLHLIVGDRPDGLNLIADGQQTIYPGGYTLAEADVSIAGRGVVMSRNFRNTAEIADFASSMVAGDEFVDIEGATMKPDVASEVVRHGMRPRVSRFTSHAGHDRSLVAQVKSLIDSGTPSGDIAVLSHTNFVATEVLSALAAAGIPALTLANYDGRTTNRVKVGTIKRAKGLEFKQVLVARAPAQLLETAWSSTDDAESERRELDRRELYVAMTRARDGLWVGVA